MVAFVVETRLRIGVLIGAALALALASLLGGCTDGRAGADVAPVRIGDRTFFLELALDHDSRVQGLSGRSYIEEDGGMLFVFPTAEVRHFVMRDCPIPIDIIFLDGAGRVVAMHRMQPEEPRRDDESDAEYEMRLKRYSSRFPAQFAVELRGGLTGELGVQPGDQLRFDVDGLKRRAE